MTKGNGMVINGLLFYIAALQPLLSRHVHSQCFLTNFKLSSPWIHTWKDKRRSRDFWRSDKSWHIPHRKKSLSDNSGAGSPLTFCPTRYASLWAYYKVKRLTVLNTVRI